MFPQRAKREKMSKKIDAPSSSSRESVADFLARGGSVTRGKTVKAKGFESLSKPSAKGSSNPRERQQRAENKFHRAS